MANKYKKPPEAKNRNFKNDNSKDEETEGALVFEENVPLSEMFPRCLYKDAVNKKLDLNPILARIGGANGNNDTFITANDDIKSNEYDVPAQNLSELSLSQEEESMSLLQR